MLPTPGKGPPPGLGEEERCLAQSRLRGFFPISTCICLWCLLPPLWIIFLGPDIFQWDPEPPCSVQVGFSFVPRVCIQ